MVSSKFNKKIMTEQKHKKKEDLILIFLIILGFGALVLGFSQFRSTIQGNLGKGQQIASQTNINQELANLSLLKVKDTDGDGLTDYDEFYLYHTSPYLADSDSDGYTDKEEIETKHDPNCPSDQSGLPCNNPLTKIDITSTSTVPNLFGEQNTDIIAQNIFSGQASPAEIRAMLLSAGMSQADLDKITDEQLLQTYSEVLTQGAGQTNVNSNTNLNLPADFKPEDISAAQLRELLLKEGVEKNLLDQIDDATLKQMFLEAMKKQ